MPRANETTDKFKTKAEKEVKNIFKALKTLREIAIQEEFTTKDEEKLFGAVKKEIDATKKVFTLKPENDSEFKF